MDAKELVAHVARRSGTTPRKRNYTRELRGQQAKGWVVVASLQPFDGEPMEYAPRSKGDPKPWKPVGFGSPRSTYRYSGRECHAVRACGVPFFGGRKCGLPTGHDKACQPRA
jgi:hypothetical protein